MRKLLAMLAAAALLALGAGQGARAAYPDHAVRMVIPFPPGGVNDIVARIVATELSKRWNQSVVVENRPGASGIIGAQAVAKSAPDGYTLLVAPSILSSHPALFPNAGYDLKKDLVPIAHVATFPVLVLTDPKLNLTNGAQLLEYIRKNSGPVYYGSPGSSSTPNMAAQWLRFKAGKLENLTAVPFKGDADIITAIMGGTIPIGFVGLPSGLPHVNGGRVRATAVSTTARAQKLPNVTTLAESGVPGYELAGWSALMAPAGTPPAIVDTISKSVGEILRDPVVAAKIVELGAIPTPSTPAEFRKYLDAEIDKMTQIVQVAGIQAN
ncbi:MAG TPA: tripartite tricarboxylate transporter substrate binding protein [Bordetella sp.]|nr:tripartite tricarboxylate transporter substrate binding protein [Bordetella sp.]